MCGVFGIWGQREAANLTYLGLHALQHRGQESAGIVTSGDTPRQFSRHLSQGLVADAFSEETLAKLPGDSAVGHVRYSTAGGTGIQNAQPLTANTVKGPIALAHNGNLVNTEQLRQELQRDGALFNSNADTEVMLHLIVRSRAPRIEDRIREALAQAEGAYTLVVLHEDGMVGLRDPFGFRPLVLGKTSTGYVFASETAALELIEAEFVREVEPGEMVCINDDGIRSERLVHRPSAGARSCVFELVYFARPNSRVYERDVYLARHEMGRQLARESRVEADVVIPVPDSGVPAALGYSEESGIPFRHGLLRSHYVGRTFIEPEQSIRHFGVKLKLSAVRPIIEGQRVVVVDDSVVRGTTSRKIVSMLKAAGAKEVHMRVSSPPTQYPCFYGIDTPTRQELIAAKHTVPEIKAYLEADSLAYLSVEGLHAAVDDDPAEPKFCNACFTGQYGEGENAIKSRLQVLPA